MPVGGCDGLYEYGEGEESGFGLRGPDADGDVVSIVALVIDERASVCDGAVRDEGSEEQGGSEDGEVSHAGIVAQDGGRRQRAERISSDE